MVVPNKKPLGCQASFDRSQTKEEEKENTYKGGRVSLQQPFCCCATYLAERFRAKGMFILMSEKGLY